MAREAPSPAFVLRGHRAAVHAVRFRPGGGGGALASGDERGAVRVWDLAARRAAGEWAAHGGDGGGVLQAVWLGPRRLLTQGKGGALSVWPLGEGAGGGGGPPEARVQTGAFSFCRCAAEPGPEPRLVAAACEDRGEARLWDLRQPRPAARVEFGDAFGGTCMTLALERLGGGGGGGGDEAAGGAGLTVLAGSEGGELAAYDVRAGRVRSQARLFEGSPAMAAAVAPRRGRGGASVLAGSAGTGLAVARVTAGGEVSVHRRLELPGEGGVSDACVRGDGRVAAVACWDRRVRLYEARGAWKPLAVLRFHTDTVHAVDLGAGADLGLLASASKDGRIAVYEGLYPARGGRA